MLTLSLTRFPSPYGRGLGEGLRLNQMSGRRKREMISFVNEIISLLLLSGGCCPSPHPQPFSQGGREPNQKTDRLVRS